MKMRVLLTVAILMLGLGTAQVDTKDYTLEQIKEMPRLAVLNNSAVRKLGMVPRLAERMAMISIHFCGRTGVKTTGFRTLKFI